jgi:MoxR-like ATPase
MIDENLNGENSLNAGKNEIREEIEGLDISHFHWERNIIQDVIKECNKLIVGQTELLELMMACIISDGHVLIEGVPGIAKTLTAKVLAKTIKSDFSRIQFTPDLMPADIIGTSVFNAKEANFTFKKGPIFSNIILIDEINRAPAKTQSALFEVMEEKQISYDSETYVMASPFLVIATQNPIEQEGTYRLPEAQLDRFLMKINMTYPSIEDELSILKLFKDSVGKVNIDNINGIMSSNDLTKIQEATKQVHIEPQMMDYLLKIVHETRNNRYIYLGASPRASLALMKVAKVIAMMEGRNFVIPDDVQYVAPHILNHRIILTPEAEISGITVHTVINNIIKEVEVPR